MTAPAHIVFEGDGGSELPRRPTTNDLGGLLLKDSVKKPPQPDEHLSVLDWKQVEYCLVRMARMIPMLTVTVTEDTGAISIDSVVSVNDALTTSTVTVAHSSGGFTVTWPANSLPATNRPPTCVFSGVSEPAYITPSQSTHSVVVTLGSMSEGSYTLDIYGE